MFRFGRDNDPACFRNFSNAHQLLNILQLDPKWNIISPKLLEHITQQTFKINNNPRVNTAIQWKSNELNQFYTKKIIETHRIREFLYVAEASGMTKRNFTRFNMSDSLEIDFLLSTTLYFQGSASYKNALDSSKSMPQDLALFNLEFAEICFRASLLFDQYFSQSFSGGLLCARERNDKNSIQIWISYFLDCYKEVMSSGTSIHIDGMKESKLFFEHYGYL